MAALPGGMIARKTNAITAADVVNRIDLIKRKNTI